MTATPKNDTNPLLDPSELAGTAEGALAAEFAARDAIEQLDEAQTPEPATSDELPLDGE